MKEKSLFLDVMGDYPINRVLDFFITFKDFDYSMTDIAKNAGVGYTTLNQFWGRLEQKGIVKFTRMVGKSKMYKLNDKNPAVKYLIKMYWQILKTETHKMFKKVEVTAIQK